MMTGNYYTESSLLCDVIRDEHRVLQAMSRFGISLGVGDHSIKEVCEQASVDTGTFLAVANFIKYGEASAPFFADGVKVTALMEYLRNAHNYFLDYQFPRIRRNLLEAVDCSSRGNEVAFLILQFFDAWTAEVRKHMQFENNKIFAYVESLLEGKGNSGTASAAPTKAFELYLRGHDAIESKLKELKNLLIKYQVPSAGVNLLNDVVFDIYICENDLDTHCEIENRLFIPAISKLERLQGGKNGNKTATAQEEEKDKEELSAREKEILEYAVRGLTNKEIAEKLFISVNTVLTHRKNISRKLNIHSIAGLTIYAIVNKMVNLEDVKSTNGKRKL